MALLKSNSKLNIGDKAPEFSLAATDNKIYSLRDFKAKALLVVFMCNHCPYVKPKIKSLVKLQKEFRSKGLQIIGINPNSANPHYEEDSFENMKAAVDEYKINFPYLNDEKQEAAKSYGATCTPDPFLFDFEKNLFYHGQIDDLHGTDGGPTTEDLKLAIEALLSKNNIDFKVMPSMGCSIKWV